MQNDTQHLKKLESRIRKARKKDRFRFRKEIRAVGKRIQTFSDEERKQWFSELDRRLSESIRKRTERIRNVPKINTIDTLPITAKKDEIIQAIRKHRVVIISGETGSGKTTQIPKFCLAALRGIDGKIGCTQPRRIAATTVAKRIAEELGDKDERVVGYKIRFQDRTPEQAYIKIMTDGILLAESQKDPFLNEYDVLIVDEAHERSLNIDFVLGFLKTLMRKRRDLKLIITSATIDTKKFSLAFDDAPIIEVSGRMFPVEVRYAGEDSFNLTDYDEDSYVDAAVAAVERIVRDDPRGGDILVFMPTEQDIRETINLLQERKLKHTFLFPLFARLRASDQAKVFAGCPGRKIIVATNVAETSITIPGIRYVVDTGLARISMYSPRKRTTSLPVAPISRSSADQRMGRCGRVADGICIRLYSEADYNRRPLYTPPEILRSNLAEVILRMISLKLGDIASFPFIDQPAQKSIRDGIDLLFELDAVKWKNGKGESTRFLTLTPKGRVMASLPLDPRLARMLIDARDHGVLPELLVIVSALSIQDPRERPSEKTEEADRMHAVFTDDSSDFLTLLRLWKTYHETLAAKKTSGKMRKFCKMHFLSYRRMREWVDIHHQIVESLKENGISVPGFGNIPDLPSRNEEKYDAWYAGIHRSILGGFLSNIAVRKEKNIYAATKGREVMVFPGSGLFNKAGSWIVAAEMVETTRLFARTAANINVNWLEEIGGEKCRSTFTNPHWERKREEVVAEEQVSLHGLVIVPGRTRSFGPVDPELATEIFIQSVLIDGDIRKPLPFMEHNQRFIREIRNLENKVRRRDLLVSDREMLTFFQDRIEHVYDMKTLRNLIRKKRGDGFLRMKKTDLLRYDPDREALESFPSRIEIRGDSFDCEYRFDPGKEKDGVTIRVSTGKVANIPHQMMDWIVPGLLKEKIAALIKALPKQYRKHLVPISETTEKIAAGIEIPKGEDIPLAVILSRRIRDTIGVHVPPSVWDECSIPDHLRMRVAVIGPDGKEIRAGRDPSVLKTVHVEETAPDLFEKKKKKLEKYGMVTWDCGDLPESVSIDGPGNMKWTAYPGLSAKETCVDLIMFDHPEKAVAAHKKGVETLYRIRFSKELKFLKKRLVLPRDTVKYTDYFGGASHFQRLFQNRVAEELFHRNIRSKKEFETWADTISSRFTTAGNQKMGIVVELLKTCHDVRTTIYQIETANRFAPEIIEFLQILRSDFDRLLPENFIELYSDERLAHIERYIRAMKIRAQRGVVDLAKDRMKEKDLKPALENLNEFLKDLSPTVSREKRDAIEDFHWMIEEYRVSLFAQELKTAIPVSAKRLRKKAEEIRGMI